MVVGCCWGCKDWSDGYHFERTGKDWALLVLAVEMIGRMVMVVERIERGCC